MKSPIRENFTSKLFYRKFAYKILFRLDTDFKGYYYPTIFNKNYEKNLTRIRHENRSISFFTNDKDIFDKTLDEFRQFAKETWKPKNQEELDLLNNKNRIIIVDKLPFKKYSYRVYFNYLKPDRRRFISSWLEKYPKTMYKMSSGVSSYFKGKGWACQTSMLISDSKMLVMMKLVFNEEINKVEEYMLRENINIMSED